MSIKQLKGKHSIAKGQRQCNNMWRKKLLPRNTKTNSARRITRGSVCRQDIHTSSSTSIPCHCWQQNSIKVYFNKNPAFGTCTVFLFRNTEQYNTIQYRTEKPSLHANTFIFSSDNICQLWWHHGQWASCQMSPNRVVATFCIPWATLGNPLRVFLGNGGLFLSSWLNNRKIYAKQSWKMCDVILHLSQLSLKGGRDSLLLLTPILKTVRLNIRAESKQGGKERQDCS